jgi:hypothetical protein
MRTTFTLLALGPAVLALAACSHGAEPAAAPATTPATTRAATPPFTTQDDAMRYLADAYNRDDRAALALVASADASRDLYGPVKPIPHGSLRLQQCSGSTCTFVWTRPDLSPATVSMLVARSASAGWVATGIAG